VSAAGLPGVRSGGAFGLACCGVEFEARQPAGGRSFRRFEAATSHSLTGSPVVPLWGRPTRSRWLSGRRPLTRSYCGPLLQERAAGGSCTSPRRFLVVEWEAATAFEVSMVFGVNIAVFVGGLSLVIVAIVVLTGLTVELERLKVTRRGSTRQRGEASRLQTNLVGVLPSLSAVS
jgi:hypothetical protein